MRGALALLVVGCSAGSPLPPPAAALNAAGVAALAAGDLETADARFSVALEYSPRFVAALVNLGLVELERGNFTRAQELFERARRLNPDVAQPHHALGVLAERTRRPDLASANYYEALRVDPGFAPARANLARLLFAAGELEEALVQFERLVQVAPADAGASAGLIETLVRLRRFDEADAALERALALTADAKALVLLDARRLLRTGKHDHAVARLTPLSQRHDELGVAALAWLAVAELESGDCAQAATLAWRALGSEPENGVATYALAVALGRLGRPEAAAWLARARRVSPRDPLLRSLGP
jgi:Flp pilus assembly protein TadD